MYLPMPHARSHIPTYRTQVHDEALSWWDWAHAHHRLVGRGAPHSWARSISRQLADIARPNASRCVGATAWLKGTGMTHTMHYLVTVHCCGDQWIVHVPRLKAWTMTDAKDMIKSAAVQLISEAAETASASIDVNLAGGRVVSSIQEFTLSAAGSQARLVSPRLSGDALADALLDRRHRPDHSVLDRGGYPPACRGFRAAPPAFGEIRTRTLKGAR